MKESVLTMQTKKNLTQEIEEMSIDYLTLEMATSITKEECLLLFMVNLEVMMMMLIELLEK